ncbi:hypothetical protein J6590_021490 [Homalodisca vitripennis]|nr:hypothetical protein J6590_021490 [Homalodisca vitripennis]
MKQRRTARERNTTGLDEGMGRGEGTELQEGRQAGGQTKDTETAIQERGVVSDHNISEQSRSVKCMTTAHGLPAIGHRHCYTDSESWRATCDTR